MSARFFGRNIRRRSLLPLVFSAIVFGITSGVADGHDCSFSARRLADAQRLTEQALWLEQQLDRVRQRALRIYLAQGVTETAPGAPSAADRRERYVQLLSEYHQALANYIQHRKDMAAHADLYHQQAQDQKALDTPIEVPTMQMLKLRAQDACYQLQAQERMLVASEMQMRSLINSITIARGQMVPQDYTKEWQIGQSGAMQLLQAAHNFEDGVIAKQNLGSKEMNQQVHLAFDTGDFVGSQKVYGEVERHNALIQEEIQRAGTHMSLARTFILKLGLLNPTAQSTADSGEAADNGSFAAADNELDKEYQHVQELYAELQSFRPTR